MATYHSFDEKKINEALQTVRDHHSDMTLDSVSAATDITGNTHMQIAGGCISVTVENGKICLSLPLGIGKICLPIPSSIPNGTAAQACIHICTTFGIPTGVKVTVTVAGVTVVSQSFGKC
ncbi:MAG: hypothetical protein ACSHWS_13560 [Sulfitobacter sp.]